MQRLVLLNVLLAFCLGGAEANAEAPGPERCPGLLVKVSAASAGEVRLACAAAADAIGLLGRCAISPRRLLHVQIQDEVRHPRGDAIMGLFDVKNERVLVTRQLSIPPLVKDTPYAELPQDDFYKSLLVHEIVHGIMHQNLRKPARSHAAYEYAAYALQIESLAPPVRDAFLRSFDPSTIETTSLFNDSVLFFNPYHFAARAYRHYKASIDGCAYLAALLDGEVAFIVASPPM